VKIHNRSGDRSLPSASSGNVSEMIAGAVANGAGTLATYPIDTIRAHFTTGESKSLGSIIRSRGVRGLYSGVTEALMLSLPMGAIYLGVFDLTRRLLITENKSKRQRSTKNARRQRSSPTSFLGSVPSMGAALTAQLATGLISVPADAIRLNTQLGISSSYLSAVRDIVRHHGPQGMYRGFAFAMGKGVPACVLRFGIFDQVQYALSTVKGSPLTSSEESAIGAFLGVTSTVLSHPLDTLHLSLVSGHAMNVTPTSLFKGLHLRLPGSVAFSYSFSSVYVAARGMLHHQRKENLRQGRRSCE